MAESMKKEKIKTIKFTLESRLENVSIAGVKIKAICDSIPLDEISSRNIELCVVEAVTNAIKHAYNSQPGNTIEIDVRLFSDKIVLRISDTGKSMDPNRCHTACDTIDFEPRIIESLPTGGMGLHIINSIMDEVDYKTIKKKNTLILTKRF